MNYLKTTDNSPFYIIILLTHYATVLMIFAYDSENNSDMFSNGLSLATAGKTRSFFREERRWWPSLWTASLSHWQPLKSYICVTMVGSPREPQPSSWIPSSSRTLMALTCKRNSHLHISLRVFFTLCVYQWAREYNRFSNFYVSHILWKYICKCVLQCG